jgi:hypothetical protein
MGDKSEDDEPLSLVLSVAERARRGDGIKEKRKKANNIFKVL